MHAMQQQSGVVPLLAVLEQLRSVVAHLSDEQYTRRPVGVVESSIGGHVRHCLDHVRSLLNALESGNLDYDHRERGRSVEAERSAALEEFRDLRMRLRQLQFDVLDRPLKLSMLMTCDGDPIDVETTVGREIAYVLSHTIHHNALIGTVVKILGGWLPDRFGYAPSTLAHLRQTACAR